MSYNRSDPVIYRRGFDAFFRCVGEREWGEKGGSCYGEETSRTSTNAGILSIRIDKRRFGVTPPGSLRSRNRSH